MQTQKQNLKIDADTPEIILLVSGSLLKGSVRNKVLLEYKSKYLGKVLTGPNFSMYDLGYTCVLSKGNTIIHCEAYSITQDAVLQKILKNTCGNEIKTVEIQDLGICYILWNPNFTGTQEQLVPSGDYRKKKLIRKSHKLDTKCKLEAEY